MSLIKKLTPVLIVLLVVALQVVSVKAAPAAQDPTPTDTATATPTDTPTATPTDTPTATPTDTPTATPTSTPVPGAPSGTIVAITLDVDDTTVPPTTTVLVTFAALADEFPPSYRLSVETAVALGLVTQDPVSGAVTVVAAMIGQPLTLDPATVLETSLYGTVVAVVIEVGGTGDDNEDADDTEDPDGSAGTGVTTVLVTVQDPAGNNHDLRLSIETALELGLVLQDPVTGEYSVNPEILGKPVSIDPAAVLPDVPSEDGEDGAGKMHPVAEALAKFFSSLLGVDYDIIKSYHDDGVGFGVMAQALWMSYQMEGDADMFGAILDAKKSGDYSALPLPEGVEVSNWGQFKKAVGKAGNLGEVMSGRAEAGEETPGEETPTETSESLSTETFKNKGQEMKAEKANKKIDPANKPEKSNNGKAKGKNR